MRDATIGNTFRTLNMQIKLEKTDKSRLLTPQQHLTEDVPHLASSKYHSVRKKCLEFLASDVSRPGPDKWKPQHVLPHHRGAAQTLSVLPA